MILPNPQQRMSQMRIREVDQAGRQTSLYIAQGVDSVIDRVDTIDVPDEVPLARRVLAIFLPAGYPNSVSADYTAYHIYNALQAFSSSIAGLLASRAVLQGLGVGDEKASATNAMLLNVLQESMGRVATIVFAHRVGSAIEAECKMYRLLADILNDVALVLDCLSPMLPKLIRVPLLGASSISRAMCGVAGVSSKATLTAHFAKSDNIGELNAKDSSQETAISLLGMWTGGLVVSYANSFTATWIWLVLLLIAHLWTNYLAVSSVSISSINRQRASIIFSSLLDQGQAPNPDQVAKKEHIFDTGYILRWKITKAIGSCEMGVSFVEILRQISNTNAKTGSAQNFGVSIADVLDIFAQEQYLLWINARDRRAVIVFFDSATVETQIKAWGHAIRAMRHIEDTKQIDISATNVLDHLRSTLSEHNAAFGGWIKQLESAGWNTVTSAMETTSSKRIIREK
jgi:Vitamin B6 photo-protection and homoeostasis